MPNFCIPAAYLHLDNIRQGIASLKKYCIRNMNDIISHLHSYPLIWKF